MNYCCHNRYKTYTNVSFLQKLHKWIHPSVFLLAARKVVLRHRCFLTSSKLKQADSRCRLQAHSYDGLPGAERLLSINESNSTAQSLWLNWICFPHLPSQPFRKTDSCGLTWDCRSHVKNCTYKLRLRKDALACCVVCWKVLWERVNPT